MTDRTRLASYISGALVLVALLASCGGEEPPPEGHRIRLRFTSLDVNVIEQVTVTFRPEGTDERFMLIEPMTFADGEITMRVDDTGDVLMTITGAHIATFAEPQSDGGHIYELEVYSDDDRPRVPAPRYIVSATRGAETIATQVGFFPAWPLPLGGATLIQMPCRMAVSEHCF